MFGSTPLGVQRQVGKGHGGFSGDERGSRTLRRRRLGFNLGPTSADAGPMSDVEAIRGMASERDLEFVDLDTYGVDPAAGEILPVDLALRYHMVAVKRKFGTPVIATSDPDDLSAQDSVRASIGREFISVVAAPEQIDAYLEELLSRKSEQSVVRETNGAAGFEGPSSGLDDTSTVELTPDDLAALVSEPVALVGEGGTDAEVEPLLHPAGSVSSPDIAPDDAAEVSAGSGITEEESAEGPKSKTVGVEPDAVDTATPDAEDGPIDSTKGSAVEAPPARRSSSGRSQKGKRGGKESGKSAPAGRPAPTPEENAAPDVSGLVEIPEPDDPEVGVAVPSGLDVDTTDTVDGLAAASEHDLAANEPPPELLDSLQVLQEEVVVDGPISVDLPAVAIDAPEPPLGQAREDVLPFAGELEALALSVEEVPDDGASDSTTEAADLVAEAVATFQELHPDEQHVEGSGFDGDSATAMFPPLAKVLVDGGRVSLEDMSAVLEEHHLTGQSVARILTNEKMVTEADLMWGMAEEMGLEFVDLDVVGVDLAEAGTIPEATARHHNVMVIATDNGTPVIAASNPTDVFAMDDLRTIMGRNFIVVVATRSQISAYIGRAFNSGGDAADMAMEASLGIDSTRQDSGVDDIQSITEEAPIVRYVNLLVLQALNERASDIHIEPTGSELRIRYRIDGVLHDVSTAPRSIAAAVTTRLKVMADLNIAEHRVPQDGRISLNVGAKGIDLRMATLPTIFGEKVVMRVLDKSSVVLGFGDLGFDEKMLTIYESLYTKPYGTILVTGPTGSGKSTTLYTTLTALNSPEKNIITVEDPVELPLKGINQVQLNLKAGLNFASALRAILRSDPDIVLIGEIRDKETASIAIEAALTGHMVLATLHTNNAASTPMRLIEMGIEPFLVTSSLSGVLAQRLARRLCTHCKEAYEPTEADVIAAGWSMAEVEDIGGMSKVYRAVGCSACSQTGYRGRKALAELLPMTEEIERMIIEGGSVEEIHRLAVSQGMSTLRQSGLLKAIEGETTLEEVLRVVA